MYYNNLYKLKKEKKLPRERRISARFQLDSTLMIIMIETIYMMLIWYGRGVLTHCDLEAEWACKI